MSKFVVGHVTRMGFFFKILNYLFLNANFALQLQEKCWKDGVLLFTARLNVTIKRLTRYKRKVVLAALLEGKSMPSNLAANTHSYYFAEKSKSHKIFPLNAFPLTFRV